MVLAPEHPLVERLTRPEQAGGGQSLLRAGRAQERSGPHRSGQGKDRRVHRLVRGQPGQRRPVPIWVADYVLASYGTGAIMAVPAHDTRDFEFAQQFELPIVPVVDPGEAPEPRDRASSAGRQDGFRGRRHRDQLQLVRRPFDAPSSRKRSPPIWPPRGRAAKRSTTSCATGCSAGSIFGASRFPILHELDAEGKPTGLLRIVRPEELPVDLPELKNFKPHGSPEPPLEQAPREWLYPTIDGKRYKRETNTMPQWAGSCWYYLRFLDPKNDRALVDPPDRKGLDAGRPVRRRGGARRAAPALRAVLAQGALRPRPRQHARAVPEAGQPGHDPGRDGVHRLSRGGGVGEAATTGRRRTKKRRKTPKGDEPGSSPPSRQSVRCRRQAGKAGRASCSKPTPAIRLDSRAYKMSKSRGNVVNPDRWSRNTAPMPCGCTKCSWARWKRRSPGAWKASTACAGFWTACGG